MTDMAVLCLDTQPPSPLHRKRHVTPSRESFLKEDLIDTKHVRDASFSSSPSSSPIARLRPVISSRRPMRTIIWIVGALGIGSYLSGRTAFTYPFSSRPTGIVSPASIPLNTIVNLAEQRLLHLQSTFDAEATMTELHVDIPYVSLPRYRDELKGYYEDYFARPSSARYGRIWDTVEQRLSLFPGKDNGPGAIRQESAGNALQGVPKSICATSMKNDLPYFFYSWANANLDWTVSWYDDRAIAAWIKESFSAYEEPNLEGRIKRAASLLVEDISNDDDHALGDFMGFIEEFNALPRGVLKSDTFRYLKLLLDGGIYTDSDTSVVRPLAEWPGLASHDPNIHVLSDPLFDIAPYVMSLAARPAIRGMEVRDGSRGTLSGGKTVSSNQLFSESLAASLDRSNDLPALVIALEFDAPYTKADWKERGYARSMQFVQWTMGAQPHHPVYLDVVGRIMQYSQQFRTNQTDLGSDSDFNLRILDWTGPGIFTDCVFRYLLNRYGVHPQQLSGLNHPVRIGDVLIYPLASFQSKKPSGFQGDFQLVYHQIMHRWHHGKDGDK